jgi:hypothetical protein
MGIGVLIRTVIIAFATVSGCAPLGTLAAFAEGAIAIASTGNVAGDGIWYGFSWGKATRETAIEVALAECRKTKVQKLVTRCQLVTTFRRECFAVAEDSKAGTPGTGWALGPDKATAGQRALAACKATAGRDRQDQCVIEKSECDERD